MNVRSAAKVTQRVMCPCCGESRNIRRDTPLLALEQQVRDHNADPWQRPPGWSVEEARKGRLQWACAYCIEQGRALIARPWIQTFCDALPYFAYYDRTLTCTDCQASFVFSAREQQYWYETLTFWVQSRPKQCPACRRKRRQDKQAQAELLTAREQLNANDSDQLLRVADLYARVGSLVKARTFFARARKRAVGAEQKAMIEQMMKELSLRQE